jgi:hypothetical protein
MNVTKFYLEKIIIKSIINYIIIFKYTYNSFLHRNQTKEKWKKKNRINDPFHNYIKNIIAFFKMYCYKIKEYSLKKYKSFLFI